MSTRSTITVRDRKDGNEAYTIYRHSDGYPDTQHGVLKTLPQALAYAWPLPRYEAMDFAAAIVAAWKQPARKPFPDAKYLSQGGNIYLTTDREAHGDSEWHYEVYPEKGNVLFGEPAKNRICVEVFKSTYPDGWENARVWKRHGKVTFLTAAMQPATAEPAEV